MALSGTVLISVILDTVGVALLAVLLYYACATLFLMRKGKLEKSWRYMSVAVIILAIGVILFALSALVQPGLTVPVMWVASTVMIIGTFLLLLGFRSHYRVWSGRELLDKGNENNRIEP